MYLKDCIVKTQKRHKGDSFTMKYVDVAPLGFENETHIFLHNSDGSLFKHFYKGDAEYTEGKGTEIKQRDYRLAIARALSQKANQIS